MSETTKRQVAVLKSIEELQTQFGISDAVLEGTKAANGWKSGKQVEEQEFKKACEAFQRAPINGNIENKEAKG